MNVEKLDLALANPSLKALKTPGEELAGSLKLTRLLGLFCLRLLPELLLLVVELGLFLVFDCGEGRCASLLLDSSMASGEDANEDPLALRFQFFASRVSSCRRVESLPEESFECTVDPAKLFPGHCREDEVGDSLPSSGRFTRELENI